MVPALYPFVFWISLIVVNSPARKEAVELHRFSAGIGWRHCSVAAEKRRRTDMNGAPLDEARADGVSSRAASEKTWR